MKIPALPLTGQSVDAQTEQAIAAIRKPVLMQALVSLSCTMCPELVTAAQRTAQPPVRFYRFF